jgi:hypothetical protein
MTFKVPGEQTGGAYAIMALSAGYGIAMVVPSPRTEQVPAQRGEEHE